MSFRKKGDEVRKKARNNQINTDMKILLNETYYEVLGHPLVIIFESEEERLKTIQNLERMGPASPVRAYAVGEDPGELDKLIGKVQDDLNRDQHRLGFDQDAEITDVRGL